MTKERIEDIRQSVIPFVKKELLEINNDGLGESDAKEFEKDLNEVLDLASKALKQPISDDCVSRESVFETIDDCVSDGLKGIFCSYNDGERFKEYIRKLPPTTPTISKGATNGDMIKTMFPWVEVKEKNNGYEVYFGIGTASQYFNYQWWNAPYESEGE